MTFRYLIRVSVLVTLSFACCSLVAETKEVTEVCGGDDKPYLSDKEPLYREIEAFQAKSLRAGGYPLFQNDSSAENKFHELCQTISNDMGWAKKDCEKLQNLTSNIARTTRCENSGPYFIAKNLMESVAKTADRVFKDAPTAVPVGTVQLQSINAGMFRFNSDKVILFNTHLFSFVNEMTKMMSTGIEFTEEGENIGLNYSQESAEKIFNSDPFFKKRFAREVYYFLTGKNKPDWWMPEKNKVLLYTRLTTWVENFIAAHEYGHFYADHNGKTNLFTRLTSRDVCNNWKNEFEADEIGLYLTYHGASQDPFFELYKSSPDLWFFSVAVLDEARQILLGKMDSKLVESITQRLISECFVEGKPIEEFQIPFSYPHRTHPPTATRMVRAWLVKAKMLGTESLEQDANWGIVLLTLWEQARPEFEKLVEKNQ